MNSIKSNALITTILLTLIFSLNVNADIKLGKTETDSQKMDTIYKSFDETEEADKTIIQTLNLTIGVGVVFFDFNRPGVAVEGSINLPINLAKGVRLGCEGEYSFKDGDDDDDDDDNHRTLTCFGQLKLTTITSLRVGYGETEGDYADYETTYIKSVRHLKNEFARLKLQAEFGIVRNQNKDDHNDDEISFAFGSKILF